MRNVLPNPFLPDDDKYESDFELNADAFLEAIEVGVVPDDAGRMDEAPSIAATYPPEFENFDLEELAGLTKPNRWRDGPATSALNNRSVSRDHQPNKADAPKRPNDV